jgi:hypothetical protein
MERHGNARASIAVSALWLCAGLLCLGGCSTVTPAQQASQGTSGSGFADGIAQVEPGVECNPTDSIVSCCLKKHPGEYERCGATPPTQKPNPPNRLPPPGTFEDKSADAKERARRKELCGDYYSRCIQQGGEDIERGQWGSTQCQSCYEECKKVGYWPAEWDDKPCPGGDT